MFMMFAMAILVVLNCLMALIVAVAWRNETQKRAGGTLGYWLLEVLFIGNVLAQLFNMGMGR